MANRGASRQPVSLGPHEYFGLQLNMLARLHSDTGVGDVNSPHRDGAADGVAVLPRCLQGTIEQLSLFSSFVTHDHDPGRLKQLRFRLTVTDKSLNVRLIRGRVNFEQDNLSR